MPLIVCAPRDAAETLGAHLKRVVGQTRLKRLFKDAAQAETVYAAEAGRQGNVIVYRERQTDRQWENAADATAQCIDVGQISNVQSVEKDVALNAHVAGEIIHAVE